MKIAQFYTVQVVQGTKIVKTESIPLCDECTRVMEPVSYQHTDRANICIRCGIKNFRKEADVV